MIVVIWKNREGLYEARASGLPGGTSWATSFGLPLGQLVLELRQRGCAWSDIDDALRHLMRRPGETTGRDVSKENLADTLGCLLPLGELGCGCFGALTVLVATAGAGFYFGVSKLLGLT